MVNSESNRRDFLKAAGAVAVTAAASHAVHAAGNDIIKVGLIGCGGRGSGAVTQCLDADACTRIVALGDVFQDKVEYQAKNLSDSEKYSDRVDLKDRVFHGLDAYKQVINAGVDLVILATPPGFRPIHLEAAINA